MKSQTVADPALEKDSSSIRLISVNWDPGMSKLLGSTPTSDWGLAFLLLEGRPSDGEEYGQAARQFKDALGEEIPTGFNLIVNPFGIEEITRESMPKVLRRYWGTVAPTDVEEGVYAMGHIYGVNRRDRGAIFDAMPRTNVGRYITEAYGLHVDPLTFGAVHGRIFSRHTEATRSACRNARAYDRPNNILVLRQNL